MNSNIFDFISVLHNFFFIRSLFFRKLLCVVHSIRKMKIFQVIQTNFKLLGVTPTQSSQKHQFNFNLLAMITWCIFSTASYVLWFLYTAKNFSEYMDAALFAFESLICTVCLLILFWKKEQWLKFIENLEIILNKSKLNHKIE